MASAVKDTGARPSTFKEFDFIVVGGGLSGLATATRLSEDPSVSVGVLESGLWKSSDPRVSTPSRAAEMWGNPDYQFFSDTVPQKHVGGRKLFCPRGHILGGGSSVNFMVWHQGSRKDYESIEALGNPGWDVDTVMRAAKKSENFHPPDTDEQREVAQTDTSFHGKDGPVHTSFSGWVPPSQKAFFDVMEKYGLVKNDKWRNGKNTGIHTSTNSIDPSTGTRSSSATAYYAPNASRPNFTVLCGAHAQKVELEKKGDLQVATGVHYVADGKPYFVKARKEVILSTGCLDSPHLLELSGIGNPSILKPLGIDVKVDNPNVGENLQDHMITTMTYMTKPGHHTQDALAEPEFAKAAAAEYAAPSKNQKHGPLGGGLGASLFIPAKLAIPEPHYKEARQKLREDMAAVSSDEGLKYFHEALDDPDRGTLEWTFLPFKFPGPTPPEPGRSYISFLVAIVHPISRGNSHVISADPKVQPAIDPHYLESSWDKSIIVHGMQELDKASRMEPLASMLERRIDPAPGDNSLATFEKYLEENVIAGVHWVGTASMLPREKGGVVDPRCKVYGTANLRVIDASIIPLHISAHPMATLYAVAERASELIMEDHKLVGKA